MFWIFYNDDTSHYIQGESCYFTQYFGNVNLSYNGLQGWTHFALAWNGKTDGDGDADFFINGVKYTDSDGSIEVSVDRETARKILKELGKGLQKVEKKLIRTGRTKKKKARKAAKE